MQVLVNADELAKDVAGAKALLERHQEHKVYQLIFILLSTFANFGFSILRSKSRVVMCVASKRDRIVKNFRPVRLRRAIAHVRLHAGLNRPRWMMFLLPY